MKPLLWILVIGAALYYFVTKYTVAGGAAQASGVSGGGGFLGLLGFGSGSPSSTLAPDSNVHTLGSTVSAPALGTPTVPYGTTPGVAGTTTPQFSPLQSRVRSGSLYVIGGPSPIISHVSPTGPSTPISPVRSFVGPRIPPVSAPAPIISRTR